MEFEKVFDSESEKVSETESHLPMAFEKASD